MTRIALAGAGAFGRKHLDALARIDEAELVCLVEPDADLGARIAAQHAIPAIVGTLDQALARDDIEAVILCTPTGDHAAQAIHCMRAGKHVEVEIPLADSLADAEAVLRVQRETGLVCMVGHTRRYNPGHAALHRRIAAGELSMQQMVAETHFFRRANINADGEPRGWTDHLLWHHAAHTVDLFAWQAGPIVAAQAMQGPLHPELGIAMDMVIQMRSESGVIGTLSLSFNNDGPLGTTFRYICDHGTWVARYDELVTGRGDDVALGDGNGIVLQDRDFLSAIREGGEPRASVQAVMPCYRVLGALETQLRGDVG